MPRRRDPRSAESAETVDRLVAEQLTYYRKRAPEYDHWFSREGRFDRGRELNARWFTEVDEVVGVLDEFDPRGQVLELACGTGIWTERLLKYADHVVAVDSALNADGRVFFIDSRYDETSTGRRSVSE